MRRVIIFGTSFAAIVALAYLWPVLGSTVNGNGRAEAADTTAPKNAQPRLTLDPNQFVGPVKEAYKFAEKNSELLAQLHCYCGCGKAEGHQNLLDCYRSTHGASCEICTGEALLAKRMSEQGSPVDQIRNAIRRNFAQDN
jgi:Protein of unknown function with PCYCGC motif